MNRIVTQKSNKVRFFTFLFLFLVLFFCNPLDVFAAGGGFFIDDNHGVTDAKSLQEQASGAYRGGKMIYSSSFDLGHFHFGETEKIIEYRLFYEKNHSGNYSKLAFFKWLLEETKLELDADVVAYADCIIFNDAYDGDPYYCTGWLYLFCDSDRYLEYAENIAGIGNEYIPLFYEEGATEGSMFITFPGQYFYYPVSNMIRDDEPDWYQTQIYTSGEDYKNNDAISVNSALRIIDYYTHASQGKGKIHDVDDFSGIWGTKDLRVFNYTMPGKYAWVMSFCCSSMVLNAENSIGQSYPYNYPIDKGYINQVFTELTTEGNPNYIESLMAYINIKNEEGTGLLPATASGGPYRGMKESSQTLGIDTIFSGVVSNGAAARVGLQKDRILNCGVLLDGTKTMENLYNKIKSLSSNDKTFKFNAENILQLYQECMVTQNIPANFVNVNGIPVALRYVWSASSSILMADGDINFPRDTANLTYSVSEKLTGDVWTTSKTSLNNSNYTASFSDFGTERYRNLDDLEKIKSIIVVLQTYPELFPAMVEKDRTVAKYVNYAKGKDALVKLNELAVKDHYKWQLCILAVGNCLYEHSLASNTPSNGWNTIYAFLRNGEQNYSTLSVGINICQTTAFIPRVSDFVMSNSYNYSDSTYGFSTENVDVKYNPTARNVIDWMHGGVDYSTDYYGGNTSVPNPNNLNKFRTVMDASSNWNKYEINCEVKQGGTIFDGLKRGNNNIIELDPDSEFAKNFDNNPENTSFKTTVFVGRIPEANPEEIVKVKEIQVLAKANYNQFDFDTTNTRNFDASSDNDSGARYSIAMFSKDGEAKTLLSGCFASFYTDYNIKVLFDIYSGNRTSYYAQNIIKVKVNPVKIQNVTNYADYEIQDKFSDYPEFGMETTRGLTAGNWESVSGESDFLPGSVVAYELDYRIPNGTTLERIHSLNQETITLLETGAWYQEYGQVITADIDFWIVPQYTDDTFAKFYNINRNTNNDWTKMRIISPVMDNIYFVEANVVGVNKTSVNVPHRVSAQTNSVGVQYAVSGQKSKRVWYCKVEDLKPGNATTEYGTDSIYVTAKWQYWSRGREEDEIDSLRSYYNYVDYYNGFKLSSGKITADGNPTRPLPRTREMGITNPKDVLTVVPNRDILNAAKDKSIRLQVPKNKCNDFDQDWEVIVVEFTGIPEKDNSVIDLVLTKGSEDFGDVTRANGGMQHEAQQIPHELTSAKLYAVIERLAPANMTWRETELKGVSDVHCHFKLTVDDAKSSGDIIGNPVGNSSIPCRHSYSLVPLSAFDFKGEKMAFYVNISGPFSYLSATANYRNYSCCYDREDINMTNNYWSEIWESTTNPNFVLDIVDGQDNIQRHVTVCKGDSCDLQPVEGVRPKLVFDIAQDNPNAEGTWTTWVHVNMDGRTPESWSGDVSYFGSAQKVTSTFSGGDTASRRITVTWPEMIIPVGGDSSRNTTYTMNPHINYGDCYKVTDETYLQDNHKEWTWTANVTCNYKYCGQTPTPCCVFDFRRNKDIKVFWGNGATYYWDVVFEWSHQFTLRTEATNVKPRPHLVNCTCPSYTKEDGTYVEKKHTHCYCYCDPGEYRGPNHGEKWWRNSGAGYPGLGKGKYYETWGLRIIVGHTGHHGGGTGEHDIGTIRVYAGEDIYWRYETYYRSNRESQPESPYTPRSQPYTTGNGGQGCFPCNILSRRPDYKNVVGPKYVDIKCSGTQDYDYDKRFVAGSGGGSACNKTYHWRPIPDVIHIEDSQGGDQGGCQVITLYICAYDFKGHTYDTYQALRGQTQDGYGWDVRVPNQGYCDSKTATIIICPSRPYIGSAQEAEGLDTSSGGQNDGVGWVDGDIWVQ